MSDNSAGYGKRKRSWEKAFSQMTDQDTEERLGCCFNDLEDSAIPVSQMLAVGMFGTEGIGGDSIRATKETVYASILGYLLLEGYPSKTRAIFKEANVNDLVLFILSPILLDFKKQTGRDLQLQRQRMLTSADSKVGGYEEFVVVDGGSGGRQSFVLMIESKREGLTQGYNQCALAMGAMRDNNGEGEVYGFVTTGENWRMVRYDGKTFQMTSVLKPLYRGIGEQGHGWMDENSVLVDCIILALYRGGIVKKDAVG